MDNSLLVEVIEHFNRNIEQNNQLNAVLMERLQRVESFKTPGAFRAKSIFLRRSFNPTSYEVTQLVTKEKNRATISIYNEGPDDIFISNELFHPESILERFSDPANPNAILPAPGQMVEIALLPNGSTMSINTTDPVFGYNLNDGGATISIIETLYEAKIDAQYAMSGLEGILHGGYGTDGMKHFD